MSISKLMFTIVGVLILAGCSTKGPGDTTVAPTPTPEVKKVTSVGVVIAQPQPTELVAGQSGETLVHLTIQKGYHVNANPPTYPYLIATDLQIKPANGVSVSRVIYPQPVTGTFAFADKPLAVYEGDNEIKAEVKAEKSATKGNQSLPATLRIQACDDQVCYPPGTIDLQIPVTIK